MTVSEFLELCIDDLLETVSESGLTISFGSGSPKVYSDLVVLLAAAKSDDFYVIDFSHIHTDTIMHMMTCFWSMKNIEDEVLNFFKYFLK